MQVNNKQMLIKYYQFAFILAALQKNINIILFSIATKQQGIYNGVKNFNKDKVRRKPILENSSLMFGKIPPQAKDLEEAILGAIMLEKSAFDTVVEILKPECFYVEAHQKYTKPCKGWQ